MKRILLFAAILTSAVAVKAQAPLGFGSMNQPFFRHYGQMADSNTHQKKWFFSKYASISAGYTWFSGGGGPFMSAPMGLQINRQLTNNLYAFAGVAVAPTIFNFNSPYNQSFNKTNSFMNNSRYGVSSSAYMGVMYVNDERTFSISGSIGVSNYYGQSPFYTPQNPTIRNYKQ
jgi:hypothetical protein